MPKKRASSGKAKKKVGVKKIRQQRKTKKPLSPIPEFLSKAVKVDVENKEVYIAKRYPSGKTLGKISPKNMAPIDIECAVEAGDIIESFNDGSALLKECEMTPDDKSDCQKGGGIIYAESNPDEAEWKRRIVLYSAISDSPEFFHHTVPVAATWFCGNNPNTGFCVSEIPDGYKLLTLKKFLRSRRGTFASSGVPDLVDKLINYGMLPDVITANSYGVLISTIKTAIKSKKIIPVLMPLPKTMVIIPPNVKSVLAPEVKQLIQSDAKSK